MFLSKNTFLVILFLVKYGHAAGSKGEKGTRSNSFTYKCMIDIKEQSNGSNLGQYVTLHNISFSPVSVVQTQTVKGNCLGVITPSNETVVLECPEKHVEETDCFNVITLEFSFEKNKTVEKDNKICLRHLGSYYFGMVTPSGWILLGSCKFVPDIVEIETQSVIPLKGDRGEHAVAGFIGNVRFNQPIRCKRHSRQ